MAENKEVIEETAAPEAPEAVEIEELSTLQKARKLVRNHSYISTGIGLIPFPVMDMVAISANQLTMLARLSNLYEVPYKKNLVKSLLSVLLYDLSAAGAVRVTSSLVKSIPVVGQVAGAIAMSGYSLAATYAIGQVFIQHFEAGGTFLDFDPQAVKEYFKEQFEEGKKVAEELKEKGKEKVTRKRTSTAKAEAEG